MMASQADLGCIRVSILRSREVKGAMEKEGKLELELRSAFSDLASFSK